MEVFKNSTGVHFLEKLLEVNYTDTIKIFQPGQIIDIDEIEFDQRTVYFARNLI